MDDKLYFIRLLVSSAAELRKLVRRAYVVDSEQRTKGHFYRCASVGRKDNPPADALNLNF